MKTSLFRSLTLLAALGTALLTATPSFGQAFSGTGTAISTTTSYYISPINSGAGIPTITYIDANLTGADTNSATALVRFYTPGEKQALTGASASGASTLTASTNGFAANDVLVVRKRSTDTYQRVTISSLSGSTITLNETLSFALTTSDEFYKMTLAGYIGNNIHQPYGKIVANANGAPIFVGKAGRPTLTEAFGAATPILRNVSGVFLSPPR